MFSSMGGWVRGVALLAGVALLVWLAVVPEVAAVPSPVGGGATAMGSSPGPRWHPPARLRFSSFLGGSAFDEATGVAVDRSGDVYVTGRTAAGGLPVTPEAFDPVFNGWGDAFVAKLRRDGSLAYVTYLGGSGEDTGRDVAVDRWGRAYVVGSTFSADFPTTGGRGHAGYVDAFVARLSADGSRLDRSTLLGGFDLDEGLALAVGDAGQVHVTGFTYSPDFPTTPRAFDTAFTGGEAFVAKLGLDGTSLAYSTFLGGTGTTAVVTDDEVGRSIAVGPQGEAYVNGYTRSTDFPTTPGAFDTTPSGDDAFVTRLSRDGSSLVYSTVIADADATDLVVDRAGSAHLVGIAGPTFPTTPDALDPVPDGSNGDAFVAALDRRGAELVYGSYLGGSAPDVATTIALGPGGDTYVGGFTYSADIPLTSDAIDTERSGLEAFLVRLGRDKSRLVYGTLLGGTQDDLALGVAAGEGGTAYVIGQTWSADFPVTLDAVQATQGGGADAFVTKIRT